MADNFPTPSNRESASPNNVLRFAPRQGNSSNSSSGNHETSYNGLKPELRDHISANNPKRPQKAMPNNIQLERDLTDAKIGAAAARTDTKFADLNGKLDLILQGMQSTLREVEGARQEAKDTRADARTTRTVVVTTAIATFLALGALIVGMSSFGATQFYNGTVLRDLIHQITAK